MEAAAKDNARKYLNRTLSAALLAIVGLTGACGKDSGHDSALYHDADDPTHSNLTHQWGIVSDGDYRRYISPLIQIEDNFLPEDNPLTERVQFWIDRFDANLRTKHADQMAGVPKPKARIILNPSMNAFIAPVPVCHNVEVRFPDSNSNDQVDQIFFDIGGGAFDLWPSEEIKCMPAGNDQVARNELAAAIREFNDRAPKGCKIALEKDGNKHFIAPGKACEANEDLLSVAGSRQLVLLRTADWVNVYAGLITEMSEREVVGVIAHELGHYYRSHVNARGDMYNLFYKAGQEVSPSRPKAVASMESIGAAALKGSALVASMERFKRVPRQKFHSALFMAAGEIAIGACEEGREGELCTKSCSQLAKMAETDEFKQATLLFPLRELNVEGLKAYADFENLASQCLAGIPVRSSAKGSAGEEGMTWEQFLRKVANPSWPGWVSDDMDVRMAMTKWLRAIVKRLPEKSPKGAKDAAALVRGVSTYLWEEEIVAVKAIQQAFDQRLGFYTDEQEADEIGAEWMSEIGLDPKAAVETYLRIGSWAEGEGKKASASLLETPAGICQELYENEWRDKDGKFRFVAIGDYLDTHHHTCYRAFNVDREIRAHKYKVHGDGKRDLLSAGDWRELQRIAEQSTGVEVLNGVSRTDRRVGHDVKRAASHATRFAHSGCAFSPF